MPGLLFCSAMLSLLTNAPDPCGQNRVELSSHSPVYSTRSDSKQCQNNAHTWIKASSIGFPPPESGQRSRSTERISTKESQQTRQDLQWPPGENRPLIGRAIFGKLPSKRQQALLVGELPWAERERSLDAGLLGIGRRKLHPLEQFRNHLSGRLKGKRTVAHKNAGVRVIKDCIALIGTAVIEGDSQEARTHLELRSQVEAKLAIEEQLIVMDGQGITGRQARNRPVQAVGGHSNRADLHEHRGDHLRLVQRIGAIEVQSNCALALR